MVAAAAAHRIGFAFRLANRIYSQIADVSAHAPAAASILLQCALASVELGCDGLRAETRTSFRPFETLATTFITETLYRAYPQAATAVGIREFEFRNFASAPGPAARRILAGAGVCAPADA